MDRFILVPPAEKSMSGNERKVKCGRFSIPFMTVNSNIQHLCNLCGSRCIPLFPVFEVLTRRSRSQLMFRSVNRHEILHLGKLKHSINPFSEPPQLPFLYLILHVNTIEMSFYTHKSASWQQSNCSHCFFLFFFFYKSQMRDVQT